MSEDKKQINTEYLSRCIVVLDISYTKMKKQPPKDMMYDLYRAACVKEFELILEQCGKLLKKRLREFFHSNKAVDKLTFKDTFRYSAKHGLMSVGSSERWLQYRDNRNDTAYNYGEKFAEQTVKLLPDFIVSAKEVVNILSKNNNGDT